MLWVGIDEAGYGPNLGPLVMTAVIAEGPRDRPPDVWLDLASAVSRAGGPADRLWVDDSKALFKARKGRARLDSACLAVVEATGLAPALTLGGLLANLGAGTLTDVELTPWVESDPLLPTSRHPGLPFSGASWRIVDVRSRLVGPARFNRGLDAWGSKALVHFDAFAGLLREVWDRSGGDGDGAEVHSDKHGGRHFYGGPLSGAIPGARVSAAGEGPALSRYVIEDGTRRLGLSLRPRADSGDGLVALASIVSKSVREAWMDAFNAHWLARIPGLRPTAGYPADARRFRTAIEPACIARGLGLELWWRAR